ncbi:MAG: amidinotransferase [Sphingobacteriales bacterium]|nr:MAG: amidinotransferase [Sphingobacteriales bacterium]TAF78787.1 MAG: amidinotransferase [Sphingobacteriales bacterium]
MIRPAAFGFNVQTADNNAFQNKNAIQDNVQQNALVEFDNFVAKLRAVDIDVIVIEDSLKPHTPDAIFPNNWVSFHGDGSVYVYPMQAPNRRLERRTDIITQLQNRFIVNQINDLSNFENQNQYLEGTGSMVLDRTNKLAYACLSGRTHPQVLEIFCAESGYQAITFNAVDDQNLPIYHTNVLMCVADKFVIICLDTIISESEKNKLLQSFKNTHKEIIPISLGQMKDFAGNMLEIKNKRGENYLILSQTAFKSLSNKQIDKISTYAKFLYTDLHTIEDNGGGSARCMLAEVCLPLK